MRRSLSNSITKLNIGNFISLEKTLILARKEQQRYQKILKYLETHTPREKIEGHVEDILIKDHFNYTVDKYGIWCSIKSYELADGIYVYNWEVAPEYQFQYKHISYVPRRIFVTSRDISPLSERIYKYTREKREKDLLEFWGDINKIPRDVLMSAESISETDIECEVIPNTIEDGKTPYIEYIQTPIGMYDAHVKETMAYCNSQGECLCEMLLFPKENQIITVVNNPDKTEKHCKNWAYTNTSIESWVKEKTTPEDDPIKLVEMSGDLGTSLSLQRLVKKL